MKISGAEQNGLVASQEKCLLALCNTRCVVHLQSVFLGSGTSASVQERQGRGGHKIINDPCLITIWMGSCRSRPCFSTVPSPIQESWISASLNFGFVPQLGGEGTSPIKITQCSYLLNNGCIMFRSQNLARVERIFPLLESSFPHSLAF